MLHSSPAAECPVYRTDARSVLKPPVLHFMKSATLPASRTSHHLVLMAYAFGSLVFTPVIKALQKRYGSRPPQYAKREASAFAQNGLGPTEIDFLAESDSFYMASVGATGWPYIQHRGGPKGFLKVLDDHTLAFADFRGNKQFISTGNLTTDDRVALILVSTIRDKARLKILGHVKILEKAESQRVDPEKLGDPAYHAGCGAGIHNSRRRVRLELYAAHHSSFHGRADPRCFVTAGRANARFGTGKRSAEG